MRLYRHKLAILVILFIILAPLHAYAVDVTNWTDRSQGITDLNGVAYGGGVFVAVGASGNTYRSSDGSAWTGPTAAGGNTLNGVAYGGGMFVAVGNGGGTYRSSDGGASWTGPTAAGANTLYGVAYGGGMFVAVGASGDTYRSSDGSAWTGPTAAGGNTLNGVAYGGGMFVAVGNGGDTYRSSDGSAWTGPTAAGANTLYGVAYGGGTFVTVSASGQTYRSSSGGASWTGPTVSGSPNLNGVAYGGGMFVAVGNSGKIYSSANLGVSWQDQSPGASNNDLQGAAYTSDTFIAVGNGGQIWQAGAVTASSSSTSTAYHAIVVYKRGAPPAGMGYVYSEPPGIYCPGDGTHISNLAIDSPSTCSAYFKEGTEVLLYTKNTNGMEFYRWEGACDGVWRGDPCDLVMGEKKVVYVRFYPPQPWLTWLKLDPVTGIGEPVTFSENTIEFTSDMLQGGCADMTVILHNNADRSINVGMIGGADPLETPFAITDDTCSGTTLPFRSDCTMKIKYCPADDGQYTDTFGVPTSDPNFPTQTVEVTGGN